MISISGKNWEKKKNNKNLIEKLKQNYNFSDILSRLVISRNFDEIELSSIKNDLGLNNVFFKNSDFKKSIELVTNSINEKENICILGDYDVDGSAATSLFVRFFESIKHPFFYYIPDREKDGYGATKKLFQKLILSKPKLVIMVDCGSTSNEAIDFLNKKYELKEIVKGDSIFCASGITNSDVLLGIDINDKNYTCETFVTHKNSSYKEIVKRTAPIIE